MKYWFVTKEIGGRKGAGILNSFIGESLSLGERPEEQGREKGNLYYGSSHSNPYWSVWV